MQTVSNSNSRTPIPVSLHSSSDVGSIEQNLINTTKPRTTAQGNLPNSGSKQEGATRQAIANAKQQATIAQGTKDQAIVNAEQTFKDNIKALAGDKSEFHQFMKTVYGDRYDPNIVETLRNKALSGDFDFLPKVKFVGSDSLRGNHAAYDAKSGTIYLNENLKADPEKLAAYYAEEAAHHIDTLFGKGDAKGDEGEMFRRVLSGEALTQTQINEIRAENDTGTIVVDGKEIEVEFGLFSKIKKGLKKIGRALENSVKSVVYKVINTAFKFHAFMANAFPILDKIDDYIADHKWAQQLVTGVATFFAGPLGAAAASAHIAYTQGADAEGILKAGALGGAMAYASGGMRAGAATMTAREFAKDQIISEVKNQLLHKIGKEIDSEPLRQLALGLVAGKIDRNDLIASFSQENLANALKDEAKDYLKDKAIERVAKEIDYPPLRDLVSNWVRNGANVEDISNAFDSFKNQLGDLNKDSLIDLLSSRAKDIKNDALKEIATAIATGKRDVNEALALFNKDNVEGMLKDYVATTIAGKAIDKANEIAYAPLRDFAIEWINNGADVGQIRDTLIGLRDKITDLDKHQALNLIKAEAKHRLRTATQDELANIKFIPAQSFATHLLFNDDIHKAMDALAPAAILNYLGSMAEDKAIEFSKEMLVQLEDHLMSNVTLAFMKQDLTR